MTWTSLTFSATMPVFYPLCFVFLFCKYWFDKYLVLNYHCKPSTFNEHLCSHQLKYFKLGIVLHIVFSLLTLSHLQLFFAPDIKPSSIGYAQNLVASEGEDGTTGEQDQEVNGDAARSAASISKLILSPP